MIILVVEDEALLAEMLQEELSDAGHRVIGPAATASEALQIASETTPELALVDINLGDGSRGTTVAQKLHACRNVPSLYMTSASDEARENRHGALGVVTKPYAIPTVLASIEVARAILHGQEPPDIPDGLELFH